MRRIWRFGQRQRVTNLQLSLSIMPWIRVVKFFFSIENYLEFLGVSLSELLCLGDIVGKNFNLGLN